MELWGRRNRVDLGAGKRFETAGKRTNARPREASRSRLAAPRGRAPRPAGRPDMALRAGSERERARSEQIEDDATAILSLMKK